MEQHEHRASLKDLAHLADRLHLRSFQCPVITVAGTNGKGSCVALLAALYQSAGSRVGHYTSPHLLRYNERIQINDQPIADEKLCEAFEAIDDVRDDKRLGYFQWTTLAALWLFQRASLDVLILEVGLGGRFDPTNLVDPSVSVITTIDLDHMHILGDTREKIALEKAGILRKDTPFVCGDRAPPAVLKAKARELKTPCFFVNQDYQISETDNAWSFQDGDVNYVDLPKPTLLLDNAAMALKVVSILHPQLPLSLVAIRQGLTQVCLPGRLQVVQGAVCEMILDVSHNRQSLLQLKAFLSQRPCAGRTLAVFGMFNDKPVAETAEIMQTVIDQWFLSELPDARSASLGQLKAAFEGMPSQAFSDIQAAYKAALAAAGHHDRIIIFGSFRTVEAVTQLLLQ